MSDRGAAGRLGCRGGVWEQVAGERRVKEGSRGRWLPERRRRAVVDGGEWRAVEGGRWKRAMTGEDSGQVIGDRKCRSAIRHAPFEYELELINVNPSTEYVIVYDYLAAQRMSTKCS